MTVTMPLTEFEELQKKLEANKDNDPALIPALAKYIKILHEYLQGARVITADSALHSAMNTFGQTATSEEKQKVGQFLDMYLKPRGI